MRPRLKRHYYSAHYASLCIILGCISHLTIILLFGVLTVKYREMTKNYIFREFECGLSIEETANICFKNVRTVKDWDAGKEIPKECKRLMRTHKRLDISHYKEWEGFTMRKGKLELPTGQKVCAQQILAGIALLEINSLLEIQTSTKIIKTARAISRIKTGL